MLGHARRATVCCLLLAVLGVLLAACGSGSGSSTSSETEEATSTESSGTSTESSAKAATGAPIKVGLVSGISGIFSASLGQVGNVAKVWEEAVNSSGGINGSPVEVIVKDDQSDASKATAAVRELVQDEVVAVAGSFTTTGAVVGPYLIEHEIPMIGGQPNGWEVENGPGFFPSGGNQAGQLYGPVKGAAEAGNSKMAVLYCAEFPTCTQESNAITTMAQEIGGIEVVTKLPISSTAPSYTAQCIKAKQAGADSMFILDAGPPILKIMSECRQQGLEVQQALAVSEVSGELYEDPISDGVIVGFTNSPAADTSTPGGKYFNEMLEKFAPGIQEKPEWNEALTSTWSGLQLFRKAAELGKVTASSGPEAVFEGLYKIKNYTIEGLSPPLSFEKGKGTYVNCYYLGEISNGEAVLKDPEAQCIPEDQAPAILKTFEG
jgi:branched-chain amino acid transport system substrate-binding protein